MAVNDSPDEAEREKLRREMFERLALNFELFRMMSLSRNV
jgi:hypothetical protein